MYSPANPMGVQHHLLDRKPVRIRRGTAAVSEEVPGRRATAGESPREGVPGAVRLASQNTALRTPR